MPAWEIPASSPAAEARGAWAIVVHGINGDRQIGLRIAPTLRRAGFNSLLISYRDDLGAPQQPRWPPPPGTDRVAGPRSRSPVRDSPWRQDKSSSIGYSMGGALIAQFMERSPLARRIDGLVLDAPALDWKAIFEFNATQMGLPSFAALPVEWAIDARTDVDWDSLDALKHPEDFHLPILLFHGDDDRWCRSPPVEELAARAASLGHLLRGAEGRPHSKLERRSSPIRPPAAPFSPANQHKNSNEPDRLGRARTKKNRRRPTLPGGCPPSTIGAERLNCSVRNGKRCFPFAMHHRKFCETAPRWSLKTAQGRNT